MVQGGITETNYRNGAEVQAECPEGDAQPELTLEEATEDSKKF